MGHRALNISRKMRYVCINVQSLSSWRNFDEISIKQDAQFVSRTRKGKIDTQYIITNQIRDFKQQ